ncbi:MAG: hypothetical protein ABW170_18685 [Candidatus Thiodiazotropha sp. L084R]
MPYIAPYRSQLRPYNHAYAYRGLTAFATLSMAVSGGRPCVVSITAVIEIVATILTTQIGYNV